ncbi:MAG: T9SS type A sorting domain-containing protein [Flavobacteriales bacterium]
MRRNLHLLLLLLVAVPGRGQTPFTYALSQDTSVNLTRPRVFERIGPDLYRVMGGSGNNDSAWTYSADIDANGQLTNMRTMRCGVNTTNAMPSCMLRTADQGLLVGFALPVVGTNAFSFVHTDVNGAVDWYRTYPDILGQWMIDSDRALAEKDGHYFTFGRMTMVPSNEGTASTMVELDSVGACVAQRIWAGGDIWSNEGQGIVRTADNGLLTVSVEHPYFSNSTWPNLSVQHWNAALQVDWSNRYSLGYMHGLVRVLATNDGGSLITGYVYPTMGGAQHAFFLRLDAAGQVIWARWGAPGTVPTAAVEEPDGGFVVTFMSGFMARLGSDGALISAQAISAFPGAFWGLSRDPLTGEHLVRGTSVANSTILFRLDAALAFDCESTPYAWTDTLVTPTVTAYPVTVTTAQLASVDTAWVSHPAVFSAVQACLPTALPELLMPAVQVWPVPADEVIHVAWTGADADPITYALVDATGRLVKQGKPARMDDRNLSIDLSGLSGGAYVLRLEGSTTRCVRVVKGHTP